MIKYKQQGKRRLWQEDSFCCERMKKNKSIEYVSIQKKQFVLISQYNSFRVKMGFRERDQSSIRSYQRISLGKRKRLVQLINQQGISLSKASKKLKIKLTTARLILKKYNQTGSFPMRNFRSKVNKSPQSELSLDVKFEEESASITIKQADIVEPPAQLIHQVYAPIRHSVPPLPPPIPYYMPYWPAPLYSWPY